MVLSLAFHACFPLAHACSGQQSAEDHRWGIGGVGHSRSPEILLSTALPLWSAAPWTLASLASDFLFCLHISGRLLVSSWFLPSYMAALKISSGNCRASVVCTPFVRDHCPGLPDVQCLKTMLHTFCLVFVGFKEKCKLVSFYSILTRNRHCKYYFRYFKCFLNNILLDT